MREICDKYGILLISDEVMSGWGRTGQWFAVDNWGVVPDIITTAKGITAGYVPLGAVIVREKIARFFDDKYLYAGLTYSGHTLACAAAVATIEVYEDDDLLANARKVGAHLGRRLEEIKARHPSVGDVRYIGLFTALELVRNRESKEPLDLAPMMKYLREHGVFAFNFKNVLFVVPPLCITEAQLDEGIQIYEAGLSQEMDPLAA
jgi:taurine--2-oxoglutarate transaminase